MPKVVLTQKAEESAYKDEPGRLYHFPKQYLRAVTEAVGDLYLVYEPRRGGGRVAYVAVGRIVNVRPDPTVADHYFADLDSYLPFDSPVPFRRPDQSFWESKVQRDDGNVNAGATGWSVRRIPEDEFQLILSAGFGEQFVTPAESTSQMLEAAEPPEAFLDRASNVPARMATQEPEDETSFERPIVQQFLSRPFRDRIFARQVCRSYDSRCAITGLKLVNGGGRTEAEAAHIKPVSQQGPDTVRNGLALSRTVHWMFDRGLISVDDDFRLLRAKKLLPEGVDRLFDPSGYIHVPEDERSRPSAAFLHWHRENCFKG